MSKSARWTEWMDQLETNDYGAKILTLQRAYGMAAGGERLGWYVAPFATRWTVGRMASEVSRFHILREDGEPLVFETVWAANRFLASILALAATPESAADARSRCTRPFLWHELTRAAQRVQRSGIAAPHYA